MRVWVLLALATSGTWAEYQLLGKPKAQPSNSQTASLRTARVTHGAIQRVLRLTGSTSAKNFAMVAAPMMRGPDFGRALILIQVAKSGGMVKKGDVVAQIDAQSRMDHIDDVDTQIQQAEADIRKRKAEQALAWEALLQNIRMTQAELDKSRLDSAAAEVRTVIDVELLKLSVEEQQATLKQQQADLPMQRAAHAAEIRILELTKERHVRHRDRHAGDVEKFTIESPISGLAVMQSIWRGNEMGQVQQGDQVAPGQPFMQVVDTSGMQVQSIVSQVESDEMRIGQPALITFDAFPDLKLKGRVASIGAIATGGGRAVNYYLRTVPVYLAILDHDNRVIPDLSTASNVVVNHSESSLVIPREAAELRDGKWFVRVKSGDEFVPREVRLGMSDNMHVAVLEGVREGDEIAIDRPAPVLVASN